MTHRHFVLYKPDGMLSQFVSQQTRRRNKRMLGELFDFPQGTMAIGRLDEHSEGLLLLTTDGKMSEYIRSRQVEKEYYVQVEGDITADALQQMSNGLNIRTDSGMYTTRPCSVQALTTDPILPPRNKRIRDARHGPTSWLSIVLTEGKFRQVRKMTAAVGHPTLRLVRVRIGQTTLGSMLPGDVLEMESFDH